MSRQFGFVCIDCNDRAYVGNTTEFFVPELEAILKNLPAIKAVMALGVFSMESSSSSYYGLPGAVRFAIEHLERDHLVVVGDEYKAVWTLCSEWARCTCCGNHFTCRRDKNHDGPCAPGNAGTTTGASP